MFCDWQTRSETACFVTDRWDSMFCDWQTGETACLVTDRQDSMFSDWHTGEAVCLLTDRQGMRQHVLWLTDKGWDSVFCGWQTRAETACFVADTDGRMGGWAGSTFSLPLTQECSRTVSRYCSITWPYLPALTQTPGHVVRQAALGAWCSTLITLSTSHLTAQHCPGWQRLPGERDKQKWGQGGELGGRGSHCMCCE